MFNTALYHATSTSVPQKHIERYAQEKGATMIKAGELNVLVFRKSIFIVRGKFLVAAFGDPSRISRTEDRIKDACGKKKHPFNFLESGHETPGCPRHARDEQGSRMWFVHAEATPRFETQFTNAGMKATQNELLTAWINEERSLVAVGKAISALIVGVKSQEVKRLALLIGITREPTVLTVPQAVPAGIIKRQSSELDPLLR